MSDASIKLICKTVAFIACLCFSGFCWKQGWNDPGFFWAIGAFFTIP